jgi:hypothetical protein
MKRAAMYCCVGGVEKAHQRSLDLQEASCRANCEAQGYQISFLFATQPFRVLKQQATSEEWELIASLIIHLNRMESAEIRRNERPSRCAIWRNPRNGHNEGGSLSFF